MSSKTSPSVSMIIGSFSVQLWRQGTRLLFRSYESKCRELNVMPSAFLKELSPSQDYRVLDLRNADIQHKDIRPLFEALRRDSVFTAIDLRGKEELASSIALSVTLEAEAPKRKQMVREIYLGNVGGECAQHLRGACELSASWRIMDEPGSAVKVGFATPPLSSTSSTTATDLTYSTTKSAMHYMTGGNSPTSAAPTASPSPYAGATSRNRGHVEDAAAAVQISRSNSAGATALNRGHSEQACGAVLASRSTPAGATPLNRGHLEDAALAVQIACPTHVASTALKGEHLQDVSTAMSSPRRTHSPASSLKRCSPTSPIATTSSPRTTYSVFMPLKRGISEGAAASMSPTSHTQNTSTRMKRSSPTSPVSGMPSPRTTYSTTVPVKRGISEHTAEAKSSLWTTSSDAVPVKRGISRDTPAAPSSPRITCSDALLVKRGLSEDTAAAISSLRTTFSATTRVKRGLSEDTTALSSPRTTFADAVQPKRGTLNDALSSSTSVFSPRPDVTKPSARARLYDIRSRSTRSNTLRDTTRHLPATATRGDGIEYIATPAPTSGTCSTTAELAANGHVPTDDPQCYGEDNEDDGDANSARNGIVTTGLDHQMGTALESKKMADTWAVTGSPRSPSSHSRAERFPSSTGSVRSPGSNSCAERASENAGNAQPQGINDRTEQVYCGAESPQHPDSNGPAKRFLQHAENSQPADSNGRVGQHVYNNGSSDAIMHALPEEAATSRALAWTSPTLEKIDCSRAGLPMLPGPILKSMTARKTRNPAQNRAPTAAHVWSLASTPDIPEVTLIEVNAQRTRSVKGVPLHSANRMHDRMFLSLKDANMAVDNAGTHEGQGGVRRSASEKVFDAEKAAETSPTTQAVHPAPRRLASFHSSLPISCSHSPKPESARVLSKRRSPAQRTAASAESPDRVSSLHHDHNERTVTTWHARTISPSDVSGTVSPRTVASRPDMSRVPSRSLTCERTVPAAVMPIPVKHARESTGMHPVSHTSPVHPVSHTSPVHRSHASPVHRSRGSRPGHESVDGMGGRTGPGDVSPECKELLSVSEFVPCDAIVDFDIAAGCATRSTVVVRPSLPDNHPRSPRAEWPPRWSDAQTTDVLDPSAFSPTQPRTTFQHADHAAPRCAQDECHALRALSAHHVSCSLTPVTKATHQRAHGTKQQMAVHPTKEKIFRDDDWTNDHGAPLDTMATIVHDDTDIARQSTGLLDATDVRARDAIGSRASMPSRLPDQCLTHVSAHGVLDVAHMHFTNGCLPDDCPLPTVYCILASRCSLGPQFSLRSTMDHLCVLDLSGNALSTFPQLDGCPKLKVLSLEDNHIATFPTSHSDNVPQPRLVELNVGHNQLTSLQGLEHFPLLRRVNIAHNCIANISHLRVLSTFPYLTLCALKGNPFTRVHGFKVTVSNIVPPTITLDCPRIKHGGNNAISTVSTPKRQSTAASDSCSGGTFFSDAGLRAALADASASGFHALLASLWKDGKLGSADADSTTTNAVARIRTRARDSSARRSMSGKGQHNMSAGKAKSRRFSTSLAPKLRTTTYSHMSSLRERVLDKFTTPSITVDHSVWANQIC